MNIIDQGNSTYPIVRVKQDQGVAVNDQLAVEEPLEIRLGYTDPARGRQHKSISITMRTPGMDVELAMGFLFTERLIDNRHSVRSIDSSKPNVIRIELDDETRVDAIRLERHFYTTSSCGICGKASLEALSLNGVDPLESAQAKINGATLRALPEMLASNQPLFRITGGNHGVALFDPQGNILRTAEDVGRHNAMDKIIGSLLMEDRLPLQEFGILVSGRASFELLQKVLAAGCPLFAAIGAPSSLAVELAQEFNITLVGFLDKSGFNIYHGQDNITL